MKKILFVTGTRADYGKLKSLIKSVEKHECFKPYIYVTGMHTLNRYGYTAQEVIKDSYENIYININQHIGDRMDMILSSTISGFSRYVHELYPDLIVTHGDRVEALAAAIVGALSNILVAHVEGGELSGTIDDSIRHSISKISHLHFVCNAEAFNRLKLMGEKEETIFEIGSPDYDLMFNAELPTLNSVLKYYDIPFEEYGIFMFHPVTTDYKKFAQYAKNVVSAINDSGKNFVAIYPNNDLGSEYIIQAFEELNKERVKIFPSISFERFLVLLENAKCIVGNSSAGIREAPCYGVPTVNIGDRQNNRYSTESIINVGYGFEEVAAAISYAWEVDYKNKKIKPFGKGDSAQRFIQCLENENFWKTPVQKGISFYD